METIVQNALALIAVYITIGAIVAIAMHGRGLHTIDPATRGAGWFFRLIITPGVIALWPALVRTWHLARRGKDAAGSLERPVSAIGIRRLHGLVMRSLAFALPIVMAAALLGRVPVLPVQASLPVVKTEATALPNVLTEKREAFDGRPIVMRLRSDGAGQFQLELDVARDIEIPTLMAYWSNESADRATPGASHLLGPVWGPGVHRYPLPERPGGGSLLLYSVSEAETIATESLAS